MFSKLRRFLRFCFRQSRIVNDQPLNKISLTVIILIDIVILANVFIGLNDIAQWHISPTAAYPCYAEWNDYRNQAADSKDFDIIHQAAKTENFSLKQQYQQGAIDHLGTLNPICLQYGEIKDSIQQCGHGTILKTLEKRRNAIETLVTSNRTILEQYESTLLEKISDQLRNQSINETSAAQAKKTLDQNNAKINSIKTAAIPNAKIRTF